LLIDFAPTRVALSHCIIKHIFNFMPAFRCHGIDPASLDQVAKPVAQVRGSGCRNVADDPVFINHHRDVAGGRHDASSGIRIEITYRFVR
jgi:hypothetical protein